MDEQVVRQLLDINQKFYSEFAFAFSETRSSAQTRLDRIVAYIGDAGKILDVGCGNGRLAERLDREGKRARYVGVDASPQMITLARVRQTRLRHVTADFILANITQPNWSAPLAHETFDIAIALAVLHHIPSFALRARVLGDLRTLLAPGARLVLTNWAFDRNERQRKRIVAWSLVGVDERALEPGDALLMWQRGGMGYRYCHLITPDEMQRLAEQSGFHVVKQYYADADLNLYSVLKV